MVQSKFLGAMIGTSYTRRGKRCTYAKETNRRFASRQLTAKMVDLTDLSAELASVGDRDGAFPLPHGRGDEFHHGSPAPEHRGLPKVRDIVDPYGHIDHIKVQSRNFH